VLQMSLRQIALCLPRQRGDMMPEDSDADVMELVIGEDGYISLIFRQSVAQVAPGLGVEQLPTTFGRIVDGVWVSRDEIVERRIEGSQGPFVSGNGAQHILLVHPPTEGLHELHLIVRVAGDLGHSIADTGRAYLEGILAQVYEDQSWYSSAKWRRCKYGSRGPSSVTSSRRT